MYTKGVKGEYLGEPLATPGMVRVKPMIAGAMGSEDGVGLGVAPGDSVAVLVGVAEIAAVLVVETVRDKEGVSKAVRELVVV